MIEKGSNVRMHYTLTVEGEEFDSSREHEPLDYVHGEGHLVPGLEREIAGMKTGERKNISVTPEEGYGLHLEEALHEVPKEAFAEPDKLEVGDRVSGQAQDQQFEATITGVTDDTVSIDLNHPLAGKTLEFDIEIVDIG